MSLEQAINQQVGKQGKTEMDLLMKISLSYLENLSSPPNFIGVRVA
jgi:hypothetical protein